MLAEPTEHGIDLRLITRPGLLPSELREHSQAA